MNSSQLLVVSYHYIQDTKTYKYPGIHPISPKLFFQHLQHYKEHFFFPSSKEVQEFADGKDLPGPSIFLTFDDGLSEHKEIAEKYLKPSDIPAAFFISSVPLLEDKGLTVNKVQWIRASTSPARMLNEIIDLISARRLEEWNGLEDRKLKEIYPYDEKDNRKIKFLYNFLLPHEEAESLVNRQLEIRGLSEPEFVRRFYMNKKQIADLSQMGYVIGAHTHSHAPISRLGIREKQDILLNVRCIEDITGIRPRWISYPYGRGSALPYRPDHFCETYGFDLGFTMEKGWNKRSFSSFSINRVSPNDLDLDQKHLLDGS